MLNSGSMTYQKKNPPDDTPRGINLKHFANTDRWFQGT